MQILIFIYNNQVNVKYWDTVKIKDLEQGSMLWVYVSGETISANFDISFNI